MAPDLLMGCDLLFEKPWLEINVCDPSWLTTSQRKGTVVLPKPLQKPTPEHEQVHFSWVNPPGRICFPKCPPNSVAPIHGESILFPQPASAIFNLPPKGLVTWWHHL
jgi:hypothetical protein